MLELSGYDLLGAILFLFGWLSYTWFADGPGAKRNNLVGIMKQHRLSWMKTMLHRDNRLIDIQIVNNLIRNTSFFASTSILIVAGLVTTLGATEEAIALLTDIPFVVETSRQVWEFKIISLIVIFVYAFFKFAWAMRQLSYCSILIGTVGKTENLDEKDYEIARQAAQISTKSALHSNRGTRAYYFGLALLVWFLHPLILIPTTLFVILVLYRREFRSQILKSLTISIRSKQGE